MIMGEVLRELSGASPLIPDLGTLTLASHPPPPTQSPPPVTPTTLAAGEPSPSVVG